MPIFTDAVLRDRLSELAARADMRRIPVATGFLTQEEAAFAVSLGQKAGVMATLNGGFDGAERVICCYHAQDVPPQFQIAMVQIKWAKRQKAPGHRDLLGSILALGMDRATLGDILIGDETATLVAQPQIAGWVADALTKAGNTTVTCKVTSDLPASPQTDEVLLTDTVASLRLDSVLASGMRTSRGKATAWIDANHVSLNHAPCLKCDKLLNTGDLISVRGYGRIRLKEVGPVTKKGRYPITLAIFSNK